MIKLKPLLSEDLKRLSLQQVIDGGFFGPVYHGTSQENLAKIGQEGFKITKGLSLWEQKTAWSLAKRMNATHK